MDRNYGYPGGDSYQGYNVPDLMAFSYNNTIASGYQDSASLSWYSPNEEMCGYYVPSYTNGGHLLNPLAPVLPASHVESPSSAPVCGTRVHINPNFHKRPSGHPEKDPGMQKPANVHINPHWKGKSESITPSGGTAIPARKTIFINPKLLAQIQSSSANNPDTAVLSDAQSSIPSVILEPLKDTEVINEDAEKAFAPTSTMFEKMPCDTSSLNSSIMQKTAEDFSDNAFHAMPIQSHAKKSVSKAIRCTQSPNSNNLCHNYDAKIQSSSTAWSSKLKVANQIRSKYKFVRSTTGQPYDQSPVKGMLTYVSKRVKKSAISAKSPFKYVKKEEWNAHTTNLSSRYKLVNKNEVFSSQRHSLLNTLSCKVALPQKLKKINNGNKTLKTRFKLVKESSAPTSKKHLPTANDGKGRKLNSRYKLVLANSTVTPSKLKSSTLCKLLQPSYPSAASLMLNSQFKLVRYSSQHKSMTSRRVSRYRIVQTSESKLKLKTQAAPLKWTRYPYSGSLLPPCELRGSWPYFHHNRIWKNRRLLHSYQRLGNKHKLRRILPVSSKLSGSSLQSSKSKSNLLTINGVLYQSTPTSLTRAQPCAPTEKVLHIRGRKFILDSTGTTLRPMGVMNDIPSQNYSQTPLSRVDIGGVTFIRKSGNTLHRTNLHHTRTLLSSAKMKSIALLTAKLRKNNQPCLIYNRFGKCLSHEKGKCWRVHDPKKVSVCQKFLQGHCEIKGCLLSHNIGPEKMPTCRYFLEGCCVRDNCPYLHVKLSARAAICRQFLDGYCAAGDMCEKRHVHICPYFECEEKCPRGKYCPYPHPKAFKTKVQNKSVSSSLSTAPVDSQNKCSNKKFSLDCNKSSNILDSGTITNLHEVEKRKRYYHENKVSSPKLSEVNENLTTSLKEKRHRLLKQIDHLKKMRCGLPNDSDVSDSSGSDIHEEEPSDIVKERPKIGILPAYIPLE